MLDDESGARESLESIVGMDLRELKRLLPGLNALAKASLLARARQEDVSRRAVTVASLAALGVSRDECRDLIARNLAAGQAKLRDSARLVLTDSGLLLLQQAIPVGAIRPMYDAASRRLSVAGETVLELAVQARNRAAVLNALELAGWPQRVSKPLAGRPCFGDAQSLASAAHRLSVWQVLVDFHADDGAITWNWRLSGGRKRRQK